MVLETTKEQYKKRTGGSEFKRLHWWEHGRHNRKWRAKDVGSSKTDPWISTSDPATKGEVTHPIGQDRAKAVARKGKGKRKEGSSSQSESSSALGGIMSTVKKLSTSFVKAQI
jgi:hypothetical protein